MSESKIGQETSRRSFLKSAGFAAAASVSPVSMDLEAQAPSVTQHASTKGARLASPVTLVSILQGTDSTPAFSAWKHTADCSASVWHGALDATDNAELVLDVSTRPAPHPGVSLHASVKSMAR